MNRIGMFVAALLTLMAEASYADRNFNLSGTAASPALVEIGVALAGSAPVTPVLTASIEAGDTASTIRNRLVPESGVFGVCKRQSSNQIRVFHADNYQYWFRVDSGPWNLIVPRSSATIVPNFTILDDGVNGIASIGNVPAVSAWGICVFGLSVLTAGVVVMLRSRNGHYQDGHSTSSIGHRRSGFSY